MKALGAALVALIVLIQYPLWLGLGVSFELGIAFTMRLGNFPWGMLAIYPVMLLPEDLVARVAGHAGGEENESGAAEHARAHRALRV